MSGHNITFNNFTISLSSGASGQCALLNSDGAWTAVNCSDTHHVLCELDCESESRDPVAVQVSTNKHSAYFSRDSYNNHDNNNRIDNNNHCVDNNNH